MSALADVPDGVLVRAEWYLRGGWDADYATPPPACVAAPGWDAGALRDCEGLRLYAPDGRGRDVTLADVRRELGARLFGGWGAAREDGR